MADLSRENIFIQVCIKEKTLYGDFNDCLYYTVAEYEAMRDEDVDAAKADRVNRFIAVREADALKPPYVPTDEDLAIEKAEYEKRIAAIEEQQAEKLAEQVVK